MNTELRLPNITGGSDREQIAQIRSYLYQLVPELQYALDLRSREEDRTGAAESPEEGWRSLGISPSAGEAREKVGRLGATDCRYRLSEDGRHVCVAFACAVSLGEAPLSVSGKPLPRYCRPSATVRAVCCAEGNAAAGIAVDPTGNVLVEWIRRGAENLTECGWIDGYLEYPI